MEVIDGLTGKRLTTVYRALTDPSEAERLIESTRRAWVECREGADEILRLMLEAREEALKTDKS